MNDAMNALVPVLDSAAELLPIAMDTPEARVMLLAIAGQESGCTARCQVITGGARGPARGLWQMERMGGVFGVLGHDSSRYWAVATCQARGVKPDAQAAWERMETDDVLAACFARLLLFTDRARLPALGAENPAWDYYKRNWRPGKPHPDRWPANFRAALAIVTGGNA